MSAIHLLVYFSNHSIESDLIKYFNEFGYVADAIVMRERET